MPVEIWEIDKWKKRMEEAKVVIPKGVCICAGCNTRLRKRKYSMTWWPHLEEVEQESNYCVTCIKNGHNLVFPRSYGVPTRDEKGKIIKGGKRLPMTERQRKEGEEIQRKMHD